MLELFVGWKYKTLTVSQVSILANPVVSSSCLLSVSCSSTVSSLLSSPFGWASYTQYTSWNERGSSTFHFTMFCILLKAMFAVLSVIFFFFFLQSSFLSKQFSKRQWFKALVLIHLFKIVPIYFDLFSFPSGWSCPYGAPIYSIWNCVRCQILMYNEDFMICLGFTPLAFV